MKLIIDPARVSNPAFNEPEKKKLSKYKSLPDEFETEIRHGMQM